MQTTRRTAVAFGLSVMCAAGLAAQTQETKTTTKTKVEVKGGKNVKVGSGQTSRKDVEEPIYFWVPSIAPSGMAFYTGDKFPEWKGNLFIGAMAGQHLVRLVLNGERVVAEEKLLVDQKQRIREVRQGPDGNLYIFLGTDLVRLTPKK